MYSLKNDTLEVQVLDPIADQARFGTRYCTGGYIFQINDAAQGPLLSGPTYPESFNTFDGQGIPDAFNRSPLRDPASTDPKALIIGVGICDLEADTVLEFCSWDVTQTDNSLQMKTTHQFQGYSLALERIVALHGRTVHSQIHLSSQGYGPVPITWFPHPFYPHLETDELCRFNTPVCFPDSPVYELSDSGFISRKGWPWQDGHFQALDHQAQSNLEILQKHPQLGLVAASCSYVPAFLPIWGNAQTFSWEPYFERTIMGGQAVSWSVDYHF